MQLARRRLRVEPQHLHVPEYVETFGPEVAEVCARAGLAPDPEQELILDATFAIRPDGLPAAFEVDMVGPRQNFKTASIKMIELGWLFVTKDRLIIHSAHEMQTTEETFRETAEIIENNPFLSRHLKPNRGERDGVTTGSNKWAIELMGDRRIRYRARQSTGGRGLAGDKVVLDEFFAVTPAIIGSLYPTLTVSPAPQVVSASSAGLLMSAALRDKRDRGRAGSTWNQFYIEFCDPDGPTAKNPYAGCKNRRCDHAKTAVGCVLDDEERWARIMPALGVRARVETIRSMRQSMPPAEFAREFMVWWEDPPDDEEVGVFGPHWNRQNIGDAKVPTPRCLALAVSPSGNASLAAVGDYGDDELKVIFPATSDPKKGGNRPGRTWAVPEVAKLARKHDVRVAIAQYGPGADLVEPLVEELGEDRVIVADMSDLKDAYAGLYDGVTETHEIFHNGSKEMTDAAGRSIKRMSGGRFLLGGRKETDDVSMIESGALAAWGERQPVPEKVDAWFSFGFGDDA